MSSFDEILNRVMGDAVETVVQRTEQNSSRPAGRRPLREPGGSAIVTYMAEVSSALNNIRSVETAAALSELSQRNSEEAAASTDGDLRRSESGIDPAQTSPSSPADNRRTISDDAEVLSGIQNAAAAMVNQVVTAGDALGNLARNASESGQSIHQASQSITVNNAVAAGGSGSIGDRLSEWLNSSSIADSVRGMVENLKQIRPVDGNAVVPASSDEGRGQGFVDRVNLAFDTFLVRSFNLFRKMSGQRYGENQEGDSSSPDDDQNQQETVEENSSNQFSSRLLKGMARGARRTLVRRFGRRIRGARANPATGPAGGTGRAGGGIFGRAFAGGGRGAAAGGAAAGGGAGGVALGGTMMMAAAGVLAFVAGLTVAASVVYDLAMKGYEIVLKVSQYDGQLSAARAQLNVSRLMRDMQSAKTFSESGTRMMETLDRLEATFRPITDGVLNLALNVLTYTVNELMDAFQYLMKATVGVLRLFDDLAEQRGRDLINDRRLAEWERIANGNAPRPGMNPDPFGDLFQRFPPAKPPRPPLPPLGGL
jgi:hypothetical protein